MISTVARMLTCHWSARRVQRYLDADPSAPLEPAEVRRLEAHLVTCDKCTALAEDFRQLDTALSRWAARRLPDDSSLARLHAVVDRIVDGDLR
jgi:anti-sigma factor RsiW